MSPTQPINDTNQAKHHQNLWLEWLQRAAKELKLDQPESLIHTDADGIARAPYYTADGPFANAKPLQLYAGDPDVTSTAPPWLAVAPVFGHSPAGINTRALHALQHGGEAILFDWSGLSAEQIPVAAHGILPQFAPFFVHGMNARALNEGLSHWMGKEMIDPKHVQGALLYDAVALINMDGQELTSIKEQFSHTFPNFNPIGADTAEWRARGLSAPQEIALCWLCVYRQLSLLTNQQISEFGRSETKIPIFLSVGCTTEFFDELSRLRALRAGIHRVMSLFQPPKTPAAVQNPLGVHPLAEGHHVNPQILVRIPNDYLPKEDPHINLLRLTTMGVSAVLGGCTALSLPPFDPQVQEQDNAFADELSLQLQMILRHEAFPNLPLDSGAGSSYIEHLSLSYGERAWAILGDMVTLCTQDHTWNATTLEYLLNEWCRQGKEREQEKRDSGRRIRVGVDRYRIVDLNQ